MKLIRRFLLPFIATLVGLTLVFALINEIDATPRVDLSQMNVPISEKAREAFINFMGIAAAPDADWKAAGQSAFHEMESGHVPDRLPIVRLEKTLSGKIPTGAYHDEKFVETNSAEIDAYLKKVAPYLSRYQEVLTKGDLANPLLPRTTNNFSSITLLKLSKALHLKWDIQLEKGDFQDTVQEAKAEWDFAEASVNHPMPLIQVMINLNIMNSIKQYLLDAAADRSAFRTALGKEKPSEFVATLDMDKLCDQARVWEHFWIKDLLEVPYQKDASFDNPIAAHYRHSNVNRILNGVNDVWLAGASGAEYQIPLSLYLYPFAAGTIKVMSFGIGHTRKKMDEHKAKLASPLF